MVLQFTMRHAKTLCLYLIMPLALALSSKHVELFPTSGRRIVKFKVILFMKI